MSLDFFFLLLTEELPSSFRSLGDVDVLEVGVRVGEGIGKGGGVFEEGGGADAGEDGRELFVPAATVANELTVLAQTTSVDSREEQDVVDGIDDGPFEVHHHLDVWAILQGELSKVGEKAIAGRT